MVSKSKPCEYEYMNTKYSGVTLNVEAILKVKHKLDKWISVQSDIPQYCQDQAPDSEARIKHYINNEPTMKLVC